MAISAGDVVPDFALLDHAGNRRRLSDLVAGDPVVLQFLRGWWCPKEQTFMRRLLALQDEAEVAYSRIVSVSVDPPDVSAAFRAGLGARWTFLSDPDRAVQRELGLRETTDTVNDPFVPVVVTLLDAPAERASLQAPVYEADGTAAGCLAVWRQRAKPTRPARRIDVRVVDPAGAAAWVSLVRPPDGVRLKFDDLAVQQARRQVLAGQPQDGVTTLLSDASHFEGALTVARGPGVARLAGDPFARIFPARILRVEAGLLGSVAAPAGPAIERYGSAQPWPWDRF